MAAPAKLHGFKISTKLAVLVGGALLALCVMGALGVYTAREIDHLGDDLYTESKQFLGVERDVSIAIERAIADVHSAPAELDLERLKAVQEHFQMLLSESRRIVTEGLAGSVETNVKAGGAKIGVAIAAFGDASKKVFAFAESFAQPDAIAALASSVVPAEAAVQAALKQFHEAADQASAARAAVIGATTENMTWIVVGLGGVLVIGLAAIAYAIVSRGVIRPLANLVALLERLAKGEEVEISGIARKDEVGDTARAVNGIKTMLTEKARRDAEDKAERDRQAAAESEAAMTRMADEFQAAVGGIVQCAAAGDFSQRVELAGKTGMVLNVGTSINGLCDNVANALNELIHMLSALADGDLTQRITSHYQGDFATIKEDANRMADKLAETVSGIKAVGREVANAAAEISGSTTDLSQRTEEQAASLEQTSASMEEMSATVKKNAENALHANQLTSGSRDVADKGGQVVAKAVDAMARIEDSSRKISDIIGVIDEIARQTNLLALNAAVEAARAGDAGRGFAVVASEVRSLAQRSSQAAKDIKVLITNSSSQVQEGVGLVNQAGTSLRDILGSIKQVADIVSEIASASSEQSTGIDQINKALNQMDEVTQQNSALVEENAASAKTLETQSDAMNEKVNFFKLDEQAGHPAGRPRAAAPRPVGKPPAPKAGADRRGPAGRLQAGLATALAQEEF